MTSRTVEINIQERKLKIACPMGEETALLLSAKTLSERLDKLSSNSSINSPEQALIMTALNLANDLLKAEKDLLIEQHNSQQKIALLQETIEQAISPAIKKQA